MDGSIYNYQKIKCFFQRRTFKSISQAYILKAFIEQHRCTCKTQNSKYVFAWFSIRDDSGQQRQHYSGLAPSNSIMGKNPIYDRLQEIGLIFQAYNLNKRQRIPKQQSKWTIQRNWQHRVHKMKKNKAKTQHNMCWTPLCARKNKYRK